jgi:hypothetical protein
MNQVVGWREHRPWATKWPMSSLGAMLITAVVGIGIFMYCSIQMWTPLQQWYWVQYLSTRPGQKVLLWRCFNSYVQPVNILGRDEDHA